MTNKKILTLILLVAVFVAASMLVKADPTGTAITFNQTDSGPTTTPANRSDSGGTITTMVLNAVQQNGNWKAYVGNITGTLTLDDSNSRTIFDWTLTASSISGEIYASRSSSPTWSSVNCSNITVVSSEQSALGFTASAADNLTNTFNETTHPAITTAGRTMPANSCNYSAATYVNDTKQSITGAFFPEVLFMDGSNLIYTTVIRQDTVGYLNTTTYDFQMIVADDPTAASTTYYFFAEIS